MATMIKNRRTAIRISEREAQKIAECANLMGCTQAEFLRRCLQVMLMVMGDEESKAAVYRILEEATSTMKMGAGLQPVPPSDEGITGTPLSVKKPRRRRSGK